MTPKANKQKGYRWEKDCQDFLADEYPDVQRNSTLYGPNDRGDLANVPDWTLQCKDTGKDEWFTWFKETEIQAGNNKTEWWAVLRKVRGKGAAHGVFAMPIWLGKQLMVYLRDLEAENRQLKARIEEQC